MAESDEKNRIKLKKICEKSIRFTKTAVDAFESIRDTAVDDDENFLDAKIYNKKMVDSLRSTIDSLTDGLLWVTENLDQIDPIDERSLDKSESPTASSSKKSKENSFSSKNNESEVKSIRKSLKTATQNCVKIPEGEKSRPESPAAKQKKTSTIDETSTSKRGKAVKTPTAKLETLMADTESSTAVPESSTANGDSVIKNVDDERQNLLNVLGIDSDEEIMQVDVGDEPEINSSTFKDATTEELSDVETKKISKRSSKITTLNDSKQKNGPCSSKIDPKSNIIPESDLSSTDGDDDDEDTNDSSEKRNFTKRKNGAVERTLTKRHEKTKTDDENGIDLEKTLKNVKNFRLDKLIHSKKSSKTNVPPKKKIKINQTNGETSLTIENSDGNEIESKENKISIASPKVVLVDCFAMASNGAPKNEREICLATLSVDSDASASISDDEVEKETESNEMKIKKCGKRKFYDSGDDLEIIDGPLNENGVDDDEKFKKTRTVSKKIEKLLKTKLKSTTTDDDENEHKVDVKPKNKTSKKKRTKIISSDEEDEEKTESNSAEEEDEEEKHSDSNSDDDDFEDKPSTSRRHPVTRRLTKGRENNSKALKKRTGRKRVAVSTDEENDGSDADEGQSPNKSGRKKIRNVISKGDLAKETIDAYEAEKERRKRIAEKQKLYNVVAEEDPNCSSLKKFKVLVLEKDPKSDETLIEVHPKLVEKLKPHQVAGIQFLYENTIESVEKSKTAGQGCVLAHCMGLGKTLQVVAYLHTILTNKRLGFRTALVVAPLNVVLNWQHEFNLWLDDELAIDVYEMSSIKQNADRVKLCDTWQEDGGVLIISYSLYLKLAMSSGKEIKKDKWKKSFQRAFLDPGPDVVVCDEGHVLKNEKTGISKIINQIRTKRRICLTGTPLQNNLNEYYTMVQFVKPNLLGSKVEFANRFANPIKNGQYVDSTPQDVACMKRRAHILHKTLDGCVNRQDYTALALALPPKFEYVVYVTLTDEQIKLYDTYLSDVVGVSQQATEADAEQLKARRSLFSDFQAFQRIWTHPYGLILHQREVERRELREEENNFVDDEEEETECSSSSEDERRRRKKRKKRKSSEENDENDRHAKGDNDDDDDDDIQIVKTYSTRRNPAAGDPAPSSRPTTPLESRGWFKGMVTEDDRTKIEIAGKFLLLFEVLKKCEAIGDKVLVFSQSLIALDMIEIFLDYFEKKGWKAHPDSLASLYKWGWKEGLDYFRLDGSTSAEKRRNYSKKFNDNNNLRARLFLISTKAGSLGMNLFGANRVIVFDASWNPTHDIQSMFRVYRFGQTKPVYIYRFIAQGTMEETIYDRGVTKQSLACRVVDEQQIDRHFSGSDLQDLYRFTPGKPRSVDKKRMNAGVPKDRLLADLMLEQKERIFDYHEHDSLLQNLDSEQLTEEERKAAWDEYEQERKNPFRNLPSRPTVAAMMTPAKDTFELFVRAMPIIQVLINEGNNIIMNSGENLDVNVEQVARNWVENDPGIKLNPAELITKLQMLILNLRQVQFNKVQQRAAAANQQQQQNSTIFPHLNKK